MLQAIIQNIPEWKVFVEAFVTLAVPLMIAYLFKWFRKPEEE
ncbi:hypothetical protein PAAL109150_15205 [Paenibacillus alkaliterrae]|nr:hypothetical protein [Paenibacillus alkaliterrae]